MKQILTTKQAADYLGYSEHTLAMSRSTGKLSGVNAPQFIKAGKAVRYRAEHLEDWLNQFGTKTETDKG